MVVRWSWLFGPSACKLFWCRCGMRWSSSSKNRMPSQKPAAAGKNASLPRSAACSIAGISKLHTDAATITPAAKPVRVRWMPSRKAFFKKNTQPAPRLVWQAEQAHHANNEKQEVPTGERPVVHIVIVCGLWQGAFYSGAHPVFCFVLNLLAHGFQPHSSNISPGHRSESNPHSPADRCR